MSDYDLENYRDCKLVSIPSGLGGTLPAAVIGEENGISEVVCLHEDIYSNWIIYVNTAETKPNRLPITEMAKRIIDSRLDS